MWTSLLRGALAGAAGTTALNAATYADMALRARATSSTPEKTVEVLADKASVSIPGDEGERENRVSGLGALLGIGTGVAVGAAYGLVRDLGLRVPVPVAAVATAVAAMGASAVPMSGMGVSDPRQWSLDDWLSDLVPHLAYGLVTAATYAMTDR